MKKTIARERPFEYLRRRSDDTPFPEQTVRNWYIARAYVLDLMKDLAVSPDDGQRQHFAVLGDSPLLLSVVRQLALSAHFINFEEYDPFGRLSCRNRTLITLVSSREDILVELGKEEYLCLLPQHCKTSIYGRVQNEDSYLDVELSVVRESPQEADVRITEEDVLAFVQSQDPETLFSIDTRRAVFLNRVYELGSVIDNLPAEDIHSARRYMLALDTFRYKLLEVKIQPLIQEARWEKNRTAVTNGISSIFCSDCFETRALGIRRYCEQHGVGEEIAWERNNLPLSLSEHNRWVVDKYIMGFRPVDEQDRLFYESLFGKIRTAYWKRLKTASPSPSHIDLCSYRELRRIDPDSMKYDSFLMLAIPIILRKLEAGR